MIYKMWSKPPWGRVVIIPTTLIWLYAIMGTTALVVQWLIIGASTDAQGAPGLTWITTNTWAIKAYMACVATGFIVWVILGIATYDGSSNKVGV